MRRTRAYCLFIGEESNRGKRLLDQLSDKNSGFEKNLSLYKNEKNVENYHLPAYDVRWEDLGRARSCKGAKRNIARIYIYIYICTPCVLRQWTRMFSPNFHADLNFKFFKFWDGPKN